MNRSLTHWPLVLLLVPLMACEEPRQPPPEDPADFARAVLEASVPPALEAGEVLFEMNCSACHGTRALGTDRGPPLVHIVYEPSHHADIAFHMAVERGVRAHHWGFGDMPPVPGLSRDEVGEIIAYVRHLQRHVGIH
jgi:mono/diheme cytochrome c family protein